MGSVSQVAAMAMTAVLLRTVPTGFVPDEDMGALMIDVSTPSGYTMAKTEEVMVRLTDRIQQLDALVFRDGDLLIRPQMFGYRSAIDGIA